MKIDNHSRSGPDVLAICVAFAWVVAMVVAGALLGAWIADAACDDEAVTGSLGCVEKVGDGFVLGAFGGLAFSVVLLLWWRGRRR